MRLWLRYVRMATVTALVVLLILTYIIPVSAVQALLQVAVVARMWDCRPGMHCRGQVHWCCCCCCCCPLHPNWDGGCRLCAQIQRLDQIPVVEKLLQIPVVRSLVVALLPGV